MTGKDIIKMSTRELKRLRVIHKVIDRSIRQDDAALILGITARQVRRLKVAVIRDGERGVIHKSRGRPSSRKISDKIREKVLGLYKDKYCGFGPTLFSEEIGEREVIKISDETISKWLIRAGLWNKERRKKAHRQWRERREGLIRRKRWNCLNAVLRSRIWATKLLRKTGVR